MPGGDRTGPIGAGPMTGRAAGYCAGYDMPGYMNSVLGRGLGRGRGRGWNRGWGRGFGWRFGGFGGYMYPVNPVSATMEKEILKNQSAVLEAELKAIKARIDEIEKDSKEK